MNSKALKIAALAVVLLVSGCETPGSQSIDETSNTTPAPPKKLPDEQPILAMGPIEPFAGTPLMFNSWIYRTFESAAPVMPTGASKAEVRHAVAEADLEILYESRSELLVRDSMPNRQGTGYPPLLYGFENGRLVLGPDGIYVVMYHYGLDGFDAEEMRSLHRMLQAEVPDPRLANSFAWIYATYDVEEVRDPKLAVEYAIRACRLTNYEHRPAVDTLAAAYARAGEFDKAVEMQQRALQMEGTTDPGYAERLELYRRGEPYTAPIEAAPFYDGRRKKLGPDPLSPQLLLNANLGDTRAQVLVAMYYLENDVNQAMGIQDPGLYYLRLSAEGGDPLAQGMLGTEYIRGDRGIERDTELGIQLMEMGARGGAFAAAYNLSRFYSGKPGVEFPTDDAKASYWMQLAADLGKPAAKFEMAYRFKKGLGVDRDPDKSQRYLDELVPADYDIIDYMQEVDSGLTALDIEPLANFIRADGQSVDASLRRVMTLVSALQQAVDNNELFASFELDGVTLVMHPVTARVAAASLARAAARLGFYDAELRLADYYESGFGFDVSQEMANLLRERASRNPHK